MHYGVLPTYCWGCDKEITLNNPNQTQKYCSKDCRKLTRNNPKHARKG